MSFADICVPGIMPRMVGTDYVIGVDVGTHSVGFAAIEIDEERHPTRVLAALSHIHDSGVDPGSQKTALTRLAVSGVARRTRRLLRRKSKRLRALDQTIREFGWPVVPLDSQSDPYLPWRVRAQLATERIDDADERNRFLSIAVRHVARHRGWRNPYTPTDVIVLGGEPSDSMTAITKAVSKAIARPVPDGLTVGQLMAATELTKDVKIRGQGGVLEAQTKQIDHANELRQIARVQGLPDDVRDQLLEKVFAAESPRGSAAGRVGLDPLPGQRGRRAPKSSEAFQRYRIAAILANLRIRVAGNKDGRVLTQDERRPAFEFLVNAKPTADPAWADVAEAIGVDRDDLRGTATPTADGDRASARPPVNRTDQVMRTSKVKALSKWWVTATEEAREAMVVALSNSGVLDEDSQAGAEVKAKLRSLTPDEMSKLDGLHLPGGRAAYSVDSLHLLTARMLSTTDDLHAARMSEFGVAPDWAPPAEPVNAPVGNPAVDRVVKVVGRQLRAAENEWGAPKTVIIEHVRDGLASEAVAREMDRENNQAFKRNQRTVQEIHEQLGVEGKPNKSDIRRYQAITRQNGQCAYCGETITYHTAEMDHVVPRRGPGSTNVRANLLAVCRRCNRDKSNTPFAVWAATCGIDGVSIDAAMARIRHWPRDPGLKPAQWARFKQDVVLRLRKTSEDPEIDNRSMESVAWMANELRDRIDRHFQEAGADTEVAVYRGGLTFDARRAAGIEKRLPFIGGAGKTRLDRRHHAIDAAVITLTTPIVARVLAERSSLRQAEHFSGRPETWKAYEGSSDNAREKFADWKSRMHALAELLSQAMDEDRIPVTGNLRLRLGNSAVHEDKIRELEKRGVGEALSAELIDRASSPALWCALTRHPDFTWEHGLPADVDRKIRLQGRYLGPDDEIGFFQTSAGCIAVRGGYAELGSAFHHARIYKIHGGKKPTYAMLRVYTIDLDAHRHEDLFSAEILPQSISRRAAETKLRKALDAGNAECIGWLVTGDELLVDMTAFNTGHVGEFLEEYPRTVRWRLDGFYSDSKFRLRPSQLAAEGLPDGAPDNHRKILDMPAWLPAVNVLLSKGRPTVIRRDALGRPRLTSARGLPVSWAVR